MRLRSTISAIELALFVLSFISPMTMHAAPGCSVETLDTIAGLGTEAAFRSCIANTTITATVTNPVGAVFQFSAVSDAAGNAVIAVPSKQTTIAGMYEVQAGPASATFEVLPDRASAAKSRLIASQKSLSVGGTTTVSAIVYDQYENPVSNHPITLLSSRLSDKITAVSAKTDIDGRALWQVTAKTAGPLVLSLFDPISGGQMPLSTTVTVGGGTTLRADLGMGQGNEIFGADLSNGVVDHFELSLPEDAATVQANELFSLTVSAVDSTGEIVRSFVGSLTVESSDPNAELPKKGEDLRNPDQGKIDMLDVYQGTRTVPLAFLFRTLGEQSITVTDKAEPDVQGKITLSVTGKQSDGNDSINVVSPIDGSTVGSHTFELVIKGPSYVDYAVRGDKHGTPLSLAADGEGIAKGTIELNEDVNEATLFISTIGGKEKMVHYKIDTSGPIIDKIEINPQEGRTDDKAEVKAISEEGLVSVTATVDGVETTLSSSESDPKTYIGEITAPKDPGTYDVNVQARDSAGNTSALTVVKWNVLSKEIAKVSGVEAIGQAMQVELKWKPVEGVEIAEYKIYVAREDDPENFLYSIGTKKPVTSAVVRDLPLIGGNYLFSLTAVDKAGTESKEKSDAVAASPLGMRLLATAGDQSLLLEWSAVANLPLSHYVLEYGVEPGVFTEKRTVNGTAETFMLRDLLAGIEYFVRLTPIALTGQTRADLAAMTSGTPEGRGFVVTSTEPVPPDTFKDLHGGAPRKPTVPSTTNSGIPTTVFMTLILFALAAFGWYMRQMNAERNRTRAFLESMQHRYHS